MDRRQIHSTLAELLVIVNEEMAGKEQELGDDTALRDGLGLDSLQVTELLFEIEDKFGTRISDEEAMELRTVGDLIALIENKLTEDR